MHEWYMYIPENPREASYFYRKLGRGDGSLNTYIWGGQTKYLPNGRRAGLDEEYISNVYDQDISRFNNASVLKPDGSSVSDAEAVFVALSSDKSVSQIGDKIQLALKMARRGRGIKIPTELDASPREITQADKNSLRVMVRRFEAATKPAAAAAAAAPLPIHASPPIPPPTPTFKQREAQRKPRKSVRFSNNIDKLPDLSTIEALNAYIDSDNGFWKEANNDEEELQDSTNAQLNSEPLDDITLQPMLTSGNNLDCLIHSFLMSTCEAFRKRIRQGDDGRVTPESRANEFASLFRKKVCPQIVKSTFDEVQGQIVESGHNARDMKAAMISDLTKTGDGNPMLLSELLIIFAAYYHINILLFGTDQRARGQGAIIPRLYEYNPEEDEPTYIISNQSGGHYEYVRVIRDGDSITISLKDAKAIKDTYEENNKADLSLRQYKDGQQIPKKVIQIISGKYNLNKNGAYFVYDVNMDAENPPGPYRPFKVEGKSYLPVPIPKSYCITEGVDTLYKYLQHEAAIVKSPEDNKRFSSKILESGKRALDITLHGTCISAEDLHTEEHRRKIIGALTAFNEEERRGDAQQPAQRENRLKNSGHTALSADEADKQIARLLAQTAPGADEDEEEQEEDDEESDEDKELDAQIAAVEARLAKIAELLKKRGRKGGSRTRRGRKTPHKQTKRRRRA